MDGARTPVSSTLIRAIVASLLAWAFQAAAQPAAEPGAFPRAGTVLKIPDQGEFGEVAIELPAYPADADLIELRQTIRDDVKFFVDARSVQIAPNEDIRYTMVVRFASGTRNVSYEAMRCSDRERIILAAGTVDRGWSLARFPRWEPVERADPLGQRGTLFRDIFCAARIPIATAQEGIAALKAGFHPRVRRD